MTGLVGKSLHLHLGVMTIFILPGDVVDFLFNADQRTQQFCPVKGLAKQVTGIQPFPAMQGMRVKMKTLGRRVTSLIFSPYLPAWKEEGVDSGGAGGNVKLRELVSSLAPYFFFLILCDAVFFFFLCNERLPWLLCSSTVMQDHSQWIASLGLCLWGADGALSSVVSTRHSYPVFLPDWPACRYRITASLHESRAAESRRRMMVQTEKWRRKTGSSQLECMRAIRLISLRPWYSCSKAFDSL